MSVLEAGLPLSLVAVAVLPLVDAVAVGLGVLPLSYVGVAKDTVPYPVAFLDAVAPLPIVDLAVCPVVDTAPVCLAALEVSLVPVAVLVPLVSLAMAHVV